MRALCKSKLWWIVLYRCSCVFMCAFMIFVRCCVVPLFHTEFITFIVSHLSLPLLSRARQFFSKKLSPIRDCCLCSFRHKIFISHSSKRTFLQIHTHTHTNVGKKRGTNNAREILHSSSPWIPLRYQPRESTFYAFWRFWFFFFLNRSHTPLPLAFIFVSESHMYNVLTNFFSLINRNNNSGVTIEGEDITQTISFQTPVVGGSNNNSARVPLHSVVVRFFWKFLNSILPPLFWVSFCLFTPPPPSSEKLKKLTKRDRRVYYMRLSLNKTERTDADNCEEYCNAHGDEEATVDGRKELLRRVCV